MCFLTLIHAGVLTSDKVNQPTYLLGTTDEFD